MEDECKPFVVNDNATIIHQSPIVNDTVCVMSITNRKEWLDALRQVYTRCTTLYIGGGGFENESKVASSLHRMFPEVNTLIVDNLDSTFVRREITNGVFPKCSLLYLNSSVSSSAVDDTYKWGNGWLRSGTTCIRYGQVAKESVAKIIYGIWTYNSTRGNEYTLHKMWSEITAKELKQVIDDVRLLT